MATDDLRESVRHLPDQLRDIAVAAADLDQLPDAGGSNRSSSSAPVALASPVM